jgi:hypothetical protein
MLVGPMQVAGDRVPVKAAQLRHLLGHAQLLVAAPVQLKQVLQRLQLLHACLGHPCRAPGLHGQQGQGAGGHRHQHPRSLGMG